MEIPKLEVGKFVDFTLEVLKHNLSGATKPFARSLDLLIKTLSKLILLVPEPVFICVFFVIVFFLVSKKISIVSSLSLLLVWSMGLWDSMIDTLVLVLFSTFISILLGIPIGIMAALNKHLDAIIRPILDFMQTLPSFVYLIPAVPFFGIGSTSAIFSTVFFAISPVIKLTSLGIKQIDKEIMEAANSFGATPWQKLIDVQIPLALPTIMTGVNQTIMMCLSMVVIAAMIGAGGVGKDVLIALQTLNIGGAFESGITVVILAITLDRITQSLNKKKF